MNANPDQLRTLIQQLQDANDGSPEFDLRIWNVITTSDQEWFLINRKTETITCNRYGPGATGNPVVTLDRITRSLDDATKTLPKGLSWGFSYNGINCVEAWIRKPSSTGRQSLFQGYTVTQAPAPADIAKALCIALLEYISDLITTSPSNTANSQGIQ